MNAGIAALQKKAHYGGILSGIVAAADHTADGEGVLRTLAYQLESLLRSRRSSHALHDRYDLQKAALSNCTVAPYTILTCFVIGKTGLISAFCQDTLMMKFCSGSAGSYSPVFSCSPFVYIPVHQIVQIGQWQDGGSSSSHDPGKSQPVALDSHSPPLPSSCHLPGQGHPPDCHLLLAVDPGPISRPAGNVLSALEFDDDDFLSAKLVNAREAFSVSDSTQLITAQWGVNSV